MIKIVFIASYQRGYRWGKDEVKALLNDIYLYNVLNGIFGQHDSWQ